MLNNVHIKKSKIPVIRSLSGAFSLLNSKQLSFLSKPWFCHFVFASFLYFLPLLVHYYGHLFDEDFLLPV
jgi:hypothetical protein